ncbi:MAG TPA: PAS domain-containing protein [Kofleriaceae bacterium]|nr:PAS domain-containing protein [Kofleriaceae bacterium]
MPPRKTTTLRRRAERTLQQRKTRKPSPRSRLIHELEVHEVELELQNEELVEARERVEAALERYTEVFDFAPIGYVTLDARGAVREINHAGAALLGAQRTALIEQQFASNVTPKSLPTFRR